MSFIDTLCQDDPAEAARYGLFMMMTGISESAWCASWMSGLDAALWDIAHGKRSREYGQDILTERQVNLIKLLSEEAGGWWVWDDKAGDAKFVSGWTPPGD